MADTFRNYAGTLKTKAANPRELVLLELEFGRETQARKKGHRSWRRYRGAARELRAFYGVHRTHEHA